MMRFLVTLLLILFSCTTAYAADDILMPAGTSPESVKPEIKAQGRGATPYIDSSILEETTADKTAADPNKPVLDIDVKDTAAAIVPEITPDIPVIKGYVPFDGENFDTLNNEMPSLFYSSEQLDLLYSKIKKYKESGGDIAAAVNNPGGEAGKEQKYTFIYYFLATVIYPKDGNWTMWLNDKKIRREDAETGVDKVKVVSVNGNSAKFRFEVDPKELKLNSPNYAKKLQLATSLITEDGASWDYVSADNNIKLDSKKGIIEFVLKLRQTFSLYDMEIKEGKYVHPTSSQDPNSLGAEGENILQGTGSDPLGNAKDINVLKKGDKGQNEDDSKDLLADPAKAERSEIKNPSTPAAEIKKAAESENPAGPMVVRPAATPQK